MSPSSPIVEARSIVKTYDTGAAKREVVGPNRLPRVVNTRLLAGLWIDAGEISTLAHIAADTGPK